MEKEVKRVNKMEKEVQRRKKEKMLSTNTRKKKEKCDPLSTISVSSAWHLPEVLWFFFSPCPAQAQIKKKKKKGQRAHQLTEVSNTCLSLHIFCQLRLAPVPGSDLKKKEKCGRPSAISVNSAWHLPEVLWFFFRLALRKHREKKKKKN